MKVHKFKNGNISLKLDDETDLESFIQSDDLFWNDLSFYQSSQDGWSFLYDANQNLVYCVNGYGYNLLDDLFSRKAVRFYAAPNDETYQDYEWNQD